MNPMAVISLTEEEKQKLVELAQNASDLLLHRAQLILAYSHGKPTLQAAREAGISTGRARFWKRQFLARRMEIFSQEIPAGTAQAEHNRVKRKQAQPGHTRSELLTAPQSQPAVPSELPYPEPRQLIGISPDDTLTEAGRKVWSFFFAEMLKHEAGTLLGENTEELHDMRVATRRMRSAFDIFGQAFDPKIMKRHLKGLRVVGRALGQVRDLDVILENGLSYQKKLKDGLRPGLDPLVKDWMEAIRKQRSSMEKDLQGESYKNFKQNFNIFLQVSESSRSTPALDDSMYSHLRDIVPVLVYSRYAAVRAYEPILPYASVIQLHALRIEYKKFRYTLEYFKEILGTGAGQAIGELKQLQDHLGELHDMDVACQLVRRFLKRWDKQQVQLPISERLNPAPVVTYLAYLHSERYRLVSAFPGLWKQFSRPEFRQNIAQAISVL